MPLILTAHGVAKGPRLVDPQPSNPVIPGPQAPPAVIPDPQKNVIPDPDRGSTYHGPRRTPSAANQSIHYVHLDTRSWPSMTAY